MASPNEDRKFHNGAGSSRTSALVKPSDSVSGALAAAAISQPISMTTPAAISAHGGLVRNGCTRVNGAVGEVPERIMQPVTVDGDDALPA